MDDNPAPQKGNSTAVIAGLLLLLGGGAGIYFLTRPAPVAPPPPPPRVVDAGAPAPTGPQIAAPIELPPEEPDSGPPVDAGVRIRYVTRYVSECPGRLSDPGAVNRTAQANYGALRACYERELRGNPTLRGGLTAQLKIGTTGRLEDVRVATSMNSRPLVECVKASLRRVATWPPARGGCAIAEVRFNFTPRE